MVELKEGKRIVAKFWTSRILQQFIGLDIFVNSSGLVAHFTGERANLCKHPIFVPAFVEAKRRVANMDIRYVEEADPVRQALLEIYVATSLGTPYNDFENH
jgi:hypothetical protein